MTWKYIDFSITSEICFVWQWGGEGHVSPPPRLHSHFKTRSGGYSDWQFALIHTPTNSQSDEFISWQISATVHTENWIRSHSTVSIFLDFFPLKPRLIYIHFCLCFCMCYTANNSFLISILLLSSKVSKHQNKIDLH